MTRIGRPPACACGKCDRCLANARARAAYAALSPDERRAITARRDREQTRKADRDRAVLPQRRADAAAQVRRWRSADRRRGRAHNAVARAIKAGTLTRGACEHGPDGCSGPVHAHHDDYALPLDVRWLCTAHHKQHHRDVAAAV